jgi:hypothetical protein
MMARVGLRTLRQAQGEGDVRGVPLMLSLSKHEAARYQGEGRA